MEYNLVSKIFRFAQRVLVYQPPRFPHRFVLDEAGGEGSEPPSASPSAGLVASLRELDALLRYARRLTAFMERAIQALRAGQWPDAAETLRTEYTALEKQQAELAPLLLAYESGKAAVGSSPVSACLEENRRIIEEIYQLPENRDLVLRRFTIPGEPPVKAMLVFVDGLSDKKIINTSVLQPLMLCAGPEQNPYSGDLAGLIIEHYLPNVRATRAVDFQTVQDGVNYGDAALFFDGVPEAVLVEAKGGEHRTVDRPILEQSVRGAQEAFTEVLSVNTALIRAGLRSSDLVTEMITVGERGRLRCAVMYLKSVASPKLVREVKLRLAGIRTDYVGDMGVLEQFIEDHPSMPFPQSLSTERPDRVTVHLAEGRVAILIDGSPFVCVVPVSLFALFHHPEDYSLKAPYSTFIRVLRMFGVFVAMMLPSFYLAISTFHQEAIPTDLLLSIASAREQVPFPTLVEILLMDFSFEFIRESGLRIPGILGPAIGIFGAIILGQAAVAAKLVSPIMVIIIALAGLASFIQPEYRLAAGIRFTRFIFLTVAALFGLVGIGAGLLILVVILCNMKSFGMPYLAPVGPRLASGLDVVMRGPVYRQERRPDALNTRDVIRQPHISRTWIQEVPEGGED